MLPAIRDNGPALTPTNRLSAWFDQFFGDDPSAPLMTAPAWPAFPLSVWEDEHAVYVEVDAPGVTDKDLELAIDGGELVIRGERKSERKGGGYDTRTYGRFEQ